jgi:hypothetical protein
MKISERTLRISAASLLALLMVGASYLLSGPNFLSNRLANAESTDELLKAYASKDTDADGLPDWQETLYGTDPNKAVSTSFGIPDGQAVAEGKLNPNTLASQLPSAQEGTTTTEDLLAEIPGVDAAPGSITEEFSHEFFQSYIKATGGQPLDADAQQQLVANLLSEFTQKARAKLVSNYTLVSVHTNTSISSDDYAQEVIDIMRAHDVTEDANQPVVLMDALIQKNDESARPKLQTLAASYAAISDDLRAAQVPPGLASQHLALIKGFDELHKATAIVADYEHDPLGVMGALAIFQPSSQDIMDAFKNIATVILSSGEPAPGTGAAVIVSIARSTETP